MKIYKNGDLLDSQCDVIAHSVNCQGVMGSGLAKQIKEKFPFNFHQYSNMCDVYGDKMLGKCMTCSRKEYGMLDTRDCLLIANLFTQTFYGTEKRQTNYEAFYTALEDLRLAMHRVNLKSVAFPYKIGCGLGGGDWRVIEAMIDSVFKTDIEDFFQVEIVKFTDVKRG